MDSVEPAVPYFDPTFDRHCSPLRAKTWAHKLGFELSQLGKYVTNVEKFHESYKQAVVKPRDGSALVHEIAKDIKAMMESKISAIKVQNSLRTQNLPYESMEA